MGSSRCKECGRTILRSVNQTCFHCWNKEKIENGGFKPGPDKLATEFKKWN